MIKIIGHNGIEHVVNESQIIKISEASASSRWHNIHCIVKLIDGTIIEAGESSSEILHKAQMARPPAVEYHLTFAELRAANLERLPLFKNANGEPAHSEPDGSDWTLGEWMNAASGETGEAANVIKKIRRGDFTPEEGREKLAKELADAITYIDLVAFRAGIDLAEAVASKWNEVSERVDVPIRIGRDGNVRI